MCVIQDSSLFPIIDLRSFPLDLYNVVNQVEVIWVTQLINHLALDHYIHNESSYFVSLDIMVVEQYIYIHTLIMVSYNDRRMLITMFEYEHHLHPHPS